MNLEQLRAKCREIRIYLDEKQISQLEQYLALLIQWNAVMDLTAICQAEEMIEKHFYDCLCSAQFITYDDQNVLDVGSGAGFPGVVLKIAFPKLKMTLLEPTGKRAKFLQEVIDQLCLIDISVVNARAEDYIKEKRSFYELVTARAVARLNILLELTIPFLKIGGRFVALKGAKCHEEIKEAKGAFCELNSEIIDEYIYSLSDSINRSVLEIKKKAEISYKYPRSYGTIKKKPL